jgi:hypothetical protein
MPETGITTDSLIERLKAEKKAATELHLRKHEDWNDNYELYRNKVKTNRLTQRQAVNIPLMKETVKTLLSKIDDAPNIDWKELGGNIDKELVYQEVWDTNFKDNKLELVDILDKKNVLLYGLSTKYLNIGSKGIDVDVLDVFDVKFDPLMEASDVETARFIIRDNIFRSVQEVLADDRYSEKGKEDLKTWMNSPAGITFTDKSRKEWEEKIERLRSMGVDHQDFPLFAGGDRLISLTEHFTTIWNVPRKSWERRVAVYANDAILLMDEKLTDLVGVDFWPFVVWSEDPETNDIYPDGIADLVRTPNKVLNVWFSQMIENRTLKNFQMHWYLPTEGYTPQTYTPGPGVMLPAPPSASGRIDDVIRPVEVNGLDDTMAAIEALTMIVERGTGATAVDKGQAEQGTQTLGEVQILVGKSMERAIGMAKFYRMSWYELATKWNAMMHANAPKVLSLYKTGQSGKIYAKKIYASDWKSEAGYEPLVVSSSEQEQESVKTLQKFMFLIQQFPENIALKDIAQKRMLQSVNLSAEELKQVEAASKPEPAAVTPQAEPQPSPVQQQDVTPDIQEMISQLAA